MIFTDRKITIRNGKSSINEPVILYRGDYEVSIKFTIMESKFRFKSGVNLVDSEKASHGQLAILTPYGGNVFSEIVKCEDGTVTFTLTKEMIDQLEEVGLYSFQIRLFDYYRESRVSIPPVEFGIEVREPVASEDHDNEVNNAIVGYSIAKVVDGLNEDVPDTFDSNGQYNKTNWKTGDRITEGKLNKIEDALDKINQNEKADMAALDKRVTNNFNVLDTNKADKNEVNSKIWHMNNMGQDVKEAMTGGSVAVVGENTILTENIVDGQVTPEKVSFIDIPEQLNLFNKFDPEIIHGKMLDTGDVVLDQVGMYISGKIPVKPNTKYTMSRIQGNWGVFYDAAGNRLSGVSSHPAAELKPGTITTPGNTAYMKINGYSQDIESYMVVEGESLPTIYTPYAAQLYLKDNVTIKSLDENIIKTNELEAEFNKLNKNFKQRINLFDKNNPDITVAFLTDWTGSLNTDHTRYLVSHLIPIECGKSYSWPANTGSFGGNNRQIAFYDKDGNVFRDFNLVDGMVTTDENDINHVTIPYSPVVKYARVNLTAETGTHKGIFMFVESDTYPEEYIPYGYDLGHEFDKAIEDIAARVLPVTPEQADSKLRGKIVSFNGDSICEGAGLKGGYGKIIANRYNMVYENIGVSGGTITAELYNSSGNARHWISRTISNMREDADYIILEGGVNDASLNAPKGEITEGYTATLDDTTYCGAFESMLKQAIERFPGKKIGYIMVHKMTANYNSETPDKHYYWSKQICEKWGVPYLDLNIECPPLNYIPSLKTTYTHNGDGWHPNELGYEKYYVDKIIAFMERL